MRRALRWIVVCLGSITLIAGCEPDSVGPTAPDFTPMMERISTAAPAPSDPAILMRQELRGRTDEVARAEVEKGENVVTIGFRPDSAPWGVNERGVSLMASDVKTEHMRTIELLAKRVIYRFQHIPAITVELPSAQVALQLRHLPWVDYVAPATSLLTPDWVDVECFPTPARGTAQGPQSIPWNVQRVRADQAWSIATGTAPQNQELMVLDDGADEQQVGVLGPELEANEYLWYVHQTANDGEHGTEVLGAAQARNNSVGTVGVAPGAPARVAKIYDADTDADRNWDYWSAIAIDENMASVRVITISYSTKQTSSSPPASFTSLYDAIKAAYGQYGVSITASTGNQGRSDYYAYPAAYPEVIGVGGSGFNDEYQYNNYAPGNVDLAAPAVNVETVCKGGAIGLADGTSFATPMVAGALMILREAFPNEAPGQLWQRLTRTAIPMANSQRSGAGRMDVYAALTYTWPPTVSISGTTYVTSAGTYTWTANATGGNGIYSYQWQKSVDGGNTYGSVLSTARTYSQYVNPPDHFYLRVTVASNGQQGRNAIYVDSYYPGGGGGGHPGPAK